MSKKKEAVRQAGIADPVWYTFVPVWAYAGSPHEMEVIITRGELLFLGNKSQMPCLRVLVPDFCDNPDFSQALMQTWQGNSTWQAQVSLFRHRMTMGARSDGLLT